MADQGTAEKVARPGVALPEWQARIQRRLRLLAGRRQRSQHGADYVGTSLTFLGLRTDDLRSLTRQIEAELPAAWEASCAALWDSPLFESRVLAILLAERHRREFRKAHWTLFTGWLREVEGWAMVDAVSDTLLAPLLVQFPELTAKTEPWLRSRSVWLRRAALVAYCTPVRHGQLADTAFAHAGTLLADRDPVIVKALSWVLRAATVSDAPRVRAFLQRHAAEMAPLAAREVRTKLETGTKSGLRRQRS